MFACPKLIKLMKFGVEVDVAGWYVGEVLCFNLDPPTVFKSSKWTWLYYIICMTCRCTWHHFCEAGPKGYWVMPLLCNQLFPYFLWQSWIWGILTSQSVIALVFTANCSIIEFSVYTICTSLLNQHFNSVDELCSKILIYYIHYYNVVRRSGEWIPDPDSLPCTETINWDLNIGHEKEKTRFLDNLSLLRKLSQIHLTSMLLDGIVLIWKICFKCT